MMDQLTANQMRVLLLVRSTGGVNLTHRGEATVSGHISKLVGLGLVHVQLSRGKYRLTPEGKRALKNIDVFNKK